MAATKKTNNKKKTPPPSLAKEWLNGLGIFVILIGILIALWTLFSVIRHLAAIYALGLPGLSFGASLMGLLAILGNVALGLLLALIGHMLFSGQSRLQAKWSLFGWLILIIATLALSHWYVPYQSLSEIFVNGFQGLGGGIFGALFAWLFVIMHFSNVLATVLFIALIILGLLLITNFKLVRIFPWLFNTASQGVASYKEQQAAKQEAKDEAMAIAYAEAQAQKFNAPPIVGYLDESVVENIDGETFVKPQQATKYVAEPTDLAGIMPKVSGMPKNEPNMVAIDASLLTAATKPSRSYVPVEINDDEDLLPEPPKAPATTATNAAPQAAPATPAANQYNAEPPAKEYVLPKPQLLAAGTKVKNPRMSQEIIDKSNKLEEALANFGVKAKVVQIISGPSIIRYELQPAAGVKVSKIVNLANDIALHLSARGMRIEAPVPGKNVIGIEVPKDSVSAVFFREIVESEPFTNSESKITLALGMDVSGQAVVTDLAKMPHLLIAGSTGSGKSVCINTMICSILFKAKPDEVKFIMIDPKKVELSNYNGLPHLGKPVVTDAKRAAGVLKEVVREMETRYSLFAASGAKNFVQYNAEKTDLPLPQIVVIIDELADLMMVASHDVEDAICRLAQMARAAGIHLLIATQRPSVDVITGLIKANVPSRIAFAVSSGIDSRTILDSVGAEKLLGKGDMLFMPIGSNDAHRIQGAFLTEPEIEKLVHFCSQQARQEFIDLPEVKEEEGRPEENSDQDELFHDAVQQVILSGQASASFLQRRFRVGYNRAARLIEAMEQVGVVSQQEGNKRKVLMSWDQFVLMHGSGEN